MNWNGQRRWLDHSIAIRQNPGNTAKLQAELDAFRRKRIFEAATNRPVFLPISFEMTAAGQVTPYRSATKSLGYDVLITGIKADTQTREIIVSRNQGDAPLAYVGDEVNLNLRVDDIAGITATTGGGQTGVFYFPTPILLKAGNILTVEMFKTDTTLEVEEANIVFLGNRVFNKAYGEALIDPLESQLIDRYIRLREIPRTVFLKQLVDFDSAVAGGEATNLYTPRVDEPLLIRGMRTTLRQSTIELGVEGEPDWTYEQTPIWGIAGEDELMYDNYIWFSKPVYLHSDTVIVIRRVVNSIDGVLIDAQTGNTVTWICETV